MYPDHQVQLDHADSRALLVATAWMVFPAIPVPEEVKAHQVEQVVLVGDGAKCLLMLAM